ncbi:MAG: MauE/DoxX family redox-associated membrane protein [Nocardioides sp.]
MRFLGLLARLILGVVWLVAGGIKLFDPASSVRAVRAYQALPEVVVPLVGYLLPAIEAVVGILLLVGLFTRWAASVSALLFAVFVAGIASVWIRGISIDCGCFGGGGARQNAAADYPWEIARDLGLLLLSGWLSYRPGTPVAVDTLLASPPANLEEKVHD